MIKVIKKILKTPYIYTLFIIIAFSLFAFAGCETAKEGMMPYNAVVVETGLTFRADFLKENMTLGSHYVDVDAGVDENGYEHIIIDETSPPFRTFIITEKAQLDEIFSAFPEIDFEKDMILIYCYTSVYGRRQKIMNITLDDKKIKIKFDIVEGKSGFKDASAPQRRFLVIKMDKLDIDIVEFLYLSNN